MIIVTIQPPTHFAVHRLDKDLQKVFTLAESRFGVEGVLLWRRRWRVLQRMLAQETARLTPNINNQEQLAIHNRIERALLGFVGTIFRPLFNIPDFTDIKALQDLISDNRHRQTAIQHHVNEMVTWINATRSMVRDNAMNIHKVQIQTREAFIRLNETQARLDKQNALITGVKISRSIDNMLHDVEISIASHIDTLRHFHVQKLDLERGWLTENILNVAHLRNCLHHVKTRGYLTLNYEWYYQHVAVTPLWEMESHLAFRAVLPAVDDDIYFGYSIVTVPVSMGGEQYRQFITNTHVAIHAMTSATFIPNDCAGTKPVVCWPALENIQRSCEAQLVNGEPPHACHIKLTKKINSTSEIVRQGKGNPEVIIAPSVGGDDITLRCPDKPAVKHFVTKPTLLMLPDTCVLESKDWKVKGVEYLHSTLRILPQEPIALPSINVSWPVPTKGTVIKELQMVDDIKVPFIHVMKWKEKEGE